jgi:hypothetical protein
VTAILIAATAFALGIGALMAYDALRRPGDERSPEQPHNPRTRADYEAEVAAPVAAVDEVAAAPLVAFVEKIGTDEFPTLAFDADPLGECIPDGYVMESETFFNDLAATRLSAFTWTAAERSTVALSSVQVVEPAPIDLESFTGSWTRAEFAALAARAETKAEASR